MESPINATWPGRLIVFFQDQGGVVDHEPDPVLIFIPVLALVYQIALPGQNPAGFPCRSELHPTSLPGRQVHSSSGPFAGQELLIDCLVLAENIAICAARICISCQIISCLYHHLP
jgi:hypothetical protein